MQDTIEAPKLTHPVLRSLTEAAKDSEHVHDHRRVPKGDRTDRLRFVSTLYRCECGDEVTF